MMKHQNIPMLLLVACLWQGGAQAASFDCAMARTGSEKAICANPELGRLDEEISEAYRTLLGKVPAPYQSKLQQSQRNWLKSRARSDDLGPAMRTRLDRLKTALSTVNGVMLLEIDGQHMPPYVLSPLPGAAAYNREVDAIWHVAQQDAAAVAHVNECDRLQDARGADTPDPATRRKLAECDGLTTTGRYYKVDFVSPDLLSVQETLMEMTWGAAHPSNSTRHLNRWLSRPGKVGPDDMFVAAGYRDTLRKGARRYLAKEGATGSPETDSEALDPDNWGLSADQLTITGQAEDYGLGRGDIEIAIPWRDFGATMRPQFLGLLKKAR